MSKGKKDSTGVNPKPKGRLKRIGEMFVKGDIWTKLSFFVLGLSNIVRGQILKGLMFLSMEIGFIFYMVIVGVSGIAQCKTLGKIAQKQVWDESEGIYRVMTFDNSMIILLLGVVSVFLIACFIFVWQAGVKAAYNAQELKENGKKLPSALEDIKAHLDSKLHRTLLFLPSIGILLFNILPIIFMIMIAFTNFDKDHQPPGSLFHWVGISNFKTMLNSGSMLGKSFWPILIWTIVWAIFATFLNYIFGMLLAMLINRKTTRCKGLWRTIFVLTIAIPQFVSLLVINNMLQRTGIINVLLQNWGWIKEPLPFLTDTTWARVTVIIVNCWVGVPYTMLITTGILQNIPAEYYEAAKVDGANAFTIFVKITLPYMLFVTTPYLITQFIGNINNFNVIYFLTGGLPASLDYYQSGTTDLLVTWLYKLTTTSFDYSYASVIGILVFVISGTLSLITYRRTGSYKNEEGFQ
ncbi:maltose/maltodextrin ABC transporter, permease protein MalF [Lachnospiraceae bacterium KM106-2]|nr:maltose/maltodextrin ABC transporter, permease protein MalF [Lachnospiraceae bacterium KM106-2]